MRNAPDCISIGSKDSDVGIQKPEVQAILKELAGIKRKEADCYEQLVAAIPGMTDEEVTEVGEKVQPSKLPRCMDQLYDRLKDLRNFRTILAVGEQIFSIYKHEQAGEPIAQVSELCERYDIGKTKLYEVLQGGKYKKEISTPKPEKRQAGSTGYNHQARGRRGNTSREGSWQEVLFKNTVRIRTKQKPRSLRDHQFLRKKI